MAHSSGSAEGGPLTRLFRSIRLGLARVLLPGEIPNPKDLAAVAPNPTGDGLWAMDRKGNIFAFGNAPEFREVPEPVPWREGSFVALTSTPTGQGLWALDSRGNIYAFGDAPEFREIPEPVPWREGLFVALASTPSGQGLWVLEKGGRILSYGDAPELQAAVQRR